MKIAVLHQLILAVCALASAGCWQEIHHVPRERTSAPVVLEREEPDPIAAEKEPEIESGPRAEPEFSTDDLFDTEEDRESASDVADFAPTAEPEPVVEEPNLAPDPRTALAAWRLGSKWSLAVGIYGKGFGPDRYGALWDEAEREAGRLHVSLPPLDAGGSPGDRAAGASALLLAEVGPQVAADLANISDAHQALFDLATKSHALLLVYTPDSSDVKALAAAIRLAAAAAGLPADMVSPLVELLDARAPFADVKGAVFQLHKDAEAHLAGHSAP